MKIPAPVEIIENGRITVSHLTEKDGKEIEHFDYRAFFSIRFSLKDEKPTTLMIKTDKSFNLVWAFSLNSGALIDNKDDKPDWLYTVLRTFNAAGEYDENEDRCLQLVRLGNGDGQYCCKLRSTSSALATHHFLSSKPVSDLTFSVENTEPEEKKTHSMRWRRLL